MNSAIEAGVALKQEKKIVFSMSDLKRSYPQSIYIYLKEICEKMLVS